MLRTWLPQDERMPTAGVTVPSVVFICDPVAARDAMIFYLQPQNRSEAPQADGQTNRI